jgi:hypothetical protein
VTDGAERLAYEVPLDPSAVRARAEEFDRAVFRGRWRELLGGYGVPEAMFVGD